MFNSFCIIHFSITTSSGSTEVPSIEPALLISLLNFLESLALMLLPQKSGLQMKLQLSVFYLNDTPHNCRVIWKLLKMTSLRVVLEEVYSVSRKRDSTGRIHVLEMW